MTNDPCRYYGCPYPANPKYDHNHPSPDPTPSPTELRAKITFQDQCRFLLRTSRYPFADRLGHRSLSDMQCDWRAEVIEEWLASNGNYQTQSCCTCCCTCCC